MRASVRTAFLTLALIGASASQAGAAGEGLAGFQSVDIKVAVPSAAGTPCAIDAGAIRARLAAVLGAGGVAVGRSAVTLRARVTTLSDAIAGGCISAIELDAFTAQNTVIQATRNPIVANIPLWSGTSVAASSASAHTERAGIAFGVLANRFVAAWKANH
ncbi:MAG: hypothetical protein ACTSUD_08035 [Alphaproteobacteria bacterium]